MVTTGGWRGVVRGGVRKEELAEERCTAWSTEGVRGWLVSCREREGREISHISPWVPEGEERGQERDLGRVGGTRKVV
jgi:hypothetical protein